jgi:hypothetical protein
MGRGSDPIRRMFELPGQRTNPHRSVASTRLGASAIATVLVLLGTFRVVADEPVAPPTCALRLSVEVTPDVPNAGDGGFISSLLGDHAGYQLFLLQVVDDTHVNLQLQGPGPAERCQAVADSIGNDGRVVSLQVY